MYMCLFWGNAAGDSPGDDTMSLLLRPLLLLLLLLPVAILYIRQLFFLVVFALVDGLCFA